MAAATAVFAALDDHGKVRRQNGLVIGTITLAGDYATGGIALNLDSNFSDGQSLVDFVVVNPHGGLVFEYDYTNKKLMAFYADYDAVADGALVQFPNATTLPAGATTGTTRALVAGR